jgi:hypothetical protein
MPPLFPTPREVFAHEFGAREVRWSGRNLSRLLRSTGERPARVAALWAVLGAFGLGDSRRRPGPGGLFDHGELWARGGVPWAVVGHPYTCGCAGFWGTPRELRAALRAFPTVRVAVDDRPGHYAPQGRPVRTRHVRVEVPAPRRPFAPPPSTWKTRAAAAAARRAFAAEFPPWEG